MVAAMPVPPRELFDGLVDDAALFPPGNAPMDQAVAEHAAHRAAPYADLVGPFLCPTSRVAELADALPADQSMAVSLVVDGTADEAQAALRRCSDDDRLRLVGLEAAAAQLGADAATVGATVSRLPGASGCLEVPRTGFDDALGLVAGTSWRVAKYRTGGVTADAHPDEAELAAILVACVGRGVPFKLTAGLHRAVRNTTGERFEQHGVLNVLVATRLAQTGNGDVTKALAERDATVLTDEVRRWGGAEAAEVRRSFRSFGCCGVQDPIGDLAGLGLVEPA
jgi:hypothetical protein